VTLGGQALAAAVADLVALLPAGKLDQVERAFAEGGNGPDQRVRWQLEGIAVLAAQDAALQRLLGAWTLTPALSGVGVAAAIAAARHVQARAGAPPEIVWTGPTAGGIVTRMTDQVVQDLVWEAQSRLLLASYVLRPDQRIVDALGDARQRGVAVTIVIESRANDADWRALRELFRDLHRRGCAILAPPPAATTEGIASTGAMHAKCVVADGRSALVSSANLTAWALDRNVELGLLLRGGPTPARIEALFTAMSAAGALAPYAVE
jgi:cardiolipin synthase